MITALFKKEIVIPYTFVDDSLSVNQYFYPDVPIEILGKLYDRGKYEGEQLCDLYLAKKLRYLEHSEWAAIKYTVQDLEKGTVKYESYNKKPLSSYSSNEQDYIWLSDFEIDVCITQALIAEANLERWDR